MMAWVIRSEFSVRCSMFDVFRLLICDVNAFQHFSFLRWLAYFARGESYGAGEKSRVPDGAEWRWEDDDVEVDRGAGEDGCGFDHAGGDGVERVEAGFARAAWAGLCAAGPRYFSASDGLGKLEDQP